MPSDPRSESVELPVDAAIALHQALGNTEAPTGSPSSKTVSVNLDPATAAKVRGALKDGLNSASAIAFTEEDEDDDDDKNG
jgi:hypothetical protein